jgi:hypothetical protein
MKNFYFIPISLALMSCNATETSKTVMKFDRDINIVTSISSYSSSMANEVYAISYRFHNEEVKFFEGENPRSFSISKKNKSISIKFCNGTIRLAEPIFVGNPRNEIIPLNLILDC